MPAGHGGLSAPRRLAATPPRGFFESENEGHMRSTASLISKYPPRRADWPFGSHIAALTRAALTGLDGENSEGETTMMKTRAAVAVEAGKPLEIMEVNLDGPRKGEVLVEIKATGL